MRPRFHAWRIKDDVSSRLLLGSIINDMVDAYLLTWEVFTLSYKRKKQVTKLRTQDHPSFVKKQKRNNTRLYRLINSWDINIINIPRLWNNEQSLSSSIFKSIFSKLYQCNVSHLQTDEWYYKLSRGGLVFGEVESLSTKLRGGDGGVPFPRGHGEGEGLCHALQGRAGSRQLVCW